MNYRYNVVKAGEYSVLPFYWLAEDGSKVPLASATVSIREAEGATVVDNQSVGSIIGGVDIEYGFTAPADLGGARSKLYIVEFRAVPSSGGSPLKSPDIWIVVERSLTS